MSFAKQSTLCSCVLYYLYNNHRFFHGEHLRWFCDRNFSKRRRGRVQRLWAGQEPGERKLFLIEDRSQEQLSVIFKRHRRFVLGFWLNYFDRWLADKIFLLFPWPIITSVGFSRLTRAAIICFRFLIGLFEYGLLLWLVIVKKARTNSFSV